VVASSPPGVSVRSASPTNGTIVSSTAPAGAAVAAASSPPPLASPSRGASHEATVTPRLRKGLASQARGGAAQRKRVTHLHDTPAYVGSAAAGAAPDVKPSASARASHASRMAACAALPAHAPKACQRARADPAQPGDRCCAAPGARKGVSASPSAAPVACAAVAALQQHKAKSSAKLCTAARRRLGDTRLYTCSNAKLALSSAAALVPAAASAFSSACAAPRRA